jgi:Transposase DDE domain
MSFLNKPSLSRRFQLVLSSFQQRDGLPFAEVLSESQIESVFAEEGGLFAQAEEDVYTPAITLWGFLSQALFKEEQRSCLAAVSRIVVLLVALGRPRPSDNTGDYCRARAKLPERAIRRLVLETAERLEQRVPVDWLWHGRHVKLVDGTTATAADTPDNQDVWPQQPQQADGLGFPILRIVVLLSLATAMVCGMELGVYAGKETSELALFRKLLGQLAEGDILLADRYYCSYFQIALLLELGVDFVTRLHQHRTADFRRGQSLGRHDHLVTWTRPQRPTWMDAETYQRMPKSITLREIRVQVQEPGFRVESFVVVTTLLDAKQYSRDDITALYRQRWMAELDIRAIKESLGLDFLRAKSPAMVRKELWTGVLAYNLIRQTMAQSALEHGVSPRKLSFTAAMQQVAATWCLLPLADDQLALLLVEAHREHLAHHEVGHRPNRIEPRAVKRRPKPHDLLTRPRAEARAALLAGHC